MKPLDLQIGIQNSYEAARVEAVRLDKPHIVGQLANEDAKREQVVRDESVVAPQAQLLEEDLFLERDYEPPEYSQTEGQGKKKKNEGKGNKPKESFFEDKPTKEENNPKPEQGRFTTYA
ncbi:MAG: hypothetical protein LDLANPLL_01160 [Turneriella sp.]|nr:hypothetical protein [Turneriella sp.]